jgi:hypothetical protein
MRRTILITVAVAILAATAWAARAATTDPTPAATATASGDLVAQLARARLATAKYATNLGAAKADAHATQKE